MIVQLNTEKLEADVLKLIRLGCTADEIPARLKGMDKYSKVPVPPLIEECAKLVEKFKRTYNSIQNIMHATIVRNIETEDCFLIFEKDYNPTPVSLNVFRTLVEPSLFKEISSRIIVCKFEYMPFDHRRIVDSQSSFPIYNTYQPPPWLADAFYNDKPELVVKRDTLPDIYHRFFTHLVGGDMMSYEYMLDWLANALRSRNMCYLVLLGEQGIGKGLFAEVLRRLFGESNFGQDLGLRITDKFNAHIANKRIVNVDEFKIETNAQEEKVKGLVNQTLPIEFKGKDVRVLPNYASYVFSSNSIDSIKLSTSDRRFSILSTTDVQAKDVFDTKFFSDLLNESNISELASYLWHREYDKERMLHVFKSQKTEIVLDTSLNEWETFFIERLCYEFAGKTVEVTEIIDRIMKQLGDVRWRVGRPALESLRGRFPGHFVLTKRFLKPEEPRKWVIIFSSREKLLEFDEKMRQFSKPDASTQHHATN